MDQDTRAPASQSLLGPPNEGYRQIAEFARIPDDDRRWDGMLKVARRLSGEYDRSAALLWLYDEEKECFHLDSYDPKEPGRELACLSLTCTSPIAKNAAQVRARTESSKEVTSWLAERSLGPRRELFPVTPTHGPAGYLEVVTDSPLAPDSTELLTDFAHVIAARIARHRDRRHLEVYEQLTELRTVQAEQPEDGADVWLKVAAKVARKATAAAVALVFRQAPDLTLRGVAADPPEIDASLCNAKRDSLIRKVFEQRVQKRVLDHSDLQERVRIFGTEACDTSLTDGLQLILQTPLRSWIAAAVTCDDEPVAVMFVANKRFESLPEVFSGTDSELIESICKILARGLAQAQTNHAIWKISDFTFRHAVHEPTERRDLLKLVQSHVPGIVAGAVSLRLREQDPPDEQWEMGELEPNAMTVLNARMQRPLRIPTSTSQKLAVVDTGHAPPYYVYEQRLPYVSEDRMAVVHLASRRERLAKFELDVLRYFGADLCQVIRSEQMVRQRNEDFIQIRHALRSGLQGVRHIDNAWEVYEQIAKKGKEPSDLQIAMLGKSLEWTRLFADRCRYLLDGSRFLLGQIRSEELRRGGHSIVNLIRETLQCLRPDALDREIEFDFQNTLTREEKVTIDRLLIAMALFNIVDNAVKYSHRKHRIRLKLSMNSREWVLAVADVGVYIRPEDRKSIFQTFVRGPTEQAQHSRPGTGLGLAVAKQVVEAHGGRVDVESDPLNPDRPDGGAVTTFVISIPR